MRRRALGVSALVVLTACARGGPPPNAPLATAADNVRADDAVLAAIVGHHEDERWSVRRADGSFVCTVPCSVWVKPHSGMTVKLESKPGVLNLEDEIVYALPDAPPAAPGDTIVLEVDRTHAGGTGGKVVAVPLTVMFGLVGVGATIMGIGGLADGGKTSTGSVDVSTKAGGDNGSVSTDTRTSSAGMGAAATTLGIGVGLLAISGLCGYWWSRSRQGGLDAIGTPTPAPRSVGLRIEPTPFGVRGTF